MDNLFLFVAAFGAGVLNALAGGGSFLTFPALVLTGVPVLAANATSAVAVFPGYLASAVAFRRELAQYPRAVLVRILCLSVLGGASGAVLLLNTPPDLFRAIVPWLLIAATVLFAFQGSLERWAGGRNSVHTWGVEALATWAVTSYAGFFNGGAGIIIVTLFSFLGHRDLKATIGLKNAMSFVLTATSVAIYASAGLVYGTFALVMMVGTIIGGYCGSLIARFLPEWLLRGVIILIGVVLSVVFFRQG